MNKISIIKYLSEENNTFHFCKTNFVTIQRTYYKLTYEEASGYKARK